MASYSALATVSGEDAAQAAGESLETLTPEPTGVGVFEVEDGSGLWEVGGYFSEPPDIAGLALISTMHGMADFVVSKIDDTDWVAQVRRELHPVHAGRFTVFGAHDSHRVGPHRIGLRIEAAMAFGTGHHGTTRGCLELFEHLLRQGYAPARVADIGCGTAVLGMAAAKALHQPVVATDIDPVAHMTARENVRANGTAPWVRTGCAPGFRHQALRDAAPFDLVFANILAGPLKRMAKDMSAHLVPGGHAILAGLMTPQSFGVIATFRGHGLVPVKRLRIGEWTSLLMRKL